MNSGEHAPTPMRGRNRTRKKTSTGSEWIVEDVASEDTLAQGRNTVDGDEQSSVAPKRRRGSDVDSELDSFLDLLHSRKNQQKSRLSNNHLSNVIPEYNLSSKDQNIDSWLRKVNECVNIYDWDEKQTIHFALQKLTGLAKKWYEALPSLVYNWTDWQEKLRKAFPDERNYGQLLQEMLARTSRFNENLQEYFYDKLSLLNRCEITGKKAVDCIIHGLVDKSIRNGAQTLCCNEPEDLLVFLISQRTTEQFNFKKRVDFMNQGRNTVGTAAPTARLLNESEVVCYNCRKQGHPFYKCPNPITRCQKRRRVGHDSELCKLTPLSNSKENKTPVNEKKE